mmetsp:Transcript_2733/g.3237  ORF Transcript_2733/g.3237 Transcript_2733/m.3237 type:complete len:291 (-) Transcript_2733:231-1103(-)
MMEEYMNCTRVEIVHDRKGLTSVINRIRHTQQGKISLLDDFTHRKLLIRKNMGSLKLCQLDRGELLREVGAINALLITIVEAEKFRVNHGNKEIQDEALELTVACWGALRELACGSVGNRTAIREFIDSNGGNGLEWMVKHLEAYDGVQWKDMNGVQIKLVTAVIGVLRNVTHKTPENCTPFHVYGLTPLLIWRVLYASEEESEHDSSLPDQSKPWREAAFRAAGTLINMIAEDKPCLQFCSMNVRLISILLHSWGSNKRLHKVFANLLRAAKERLPFDKYSPNWDTIIK